MHPINMIVAITLWTAGWILISSATYGVDPRAGAAVAGIGLIVSACCVKDDPEDERDD